MQPKERLPAGWGWRSSNSRGFRGLTPASAALLAAATAAGLAWGAAVIAGARALESDTDVLRWAGAAVVGLPPLAVALFFKRRQGRLDEFQALLEARALMLGALWALSVGALLFALTALQGEPAPAWLIVLLPPAGFSFGSLMLIMERQNLAGPGEERS